MSIGYFTVPADYKYLVAAYSLLPLVHLYVDLNVMSLRSKAKVSLPKLFAEEANTSATEDSAEKKELAIAQHKFNCAQKASMNFTEHVPSFIVASAVAGLQYPKIAAGLTVWYAISRVIYHMGYTTGNPKKRAGPLSFLPYVGTVLFGCACAIKSLWF